jgi:hypothetical protein
MVHVFDGSHAPVWYWIACHCVLTVLASISFGCSIFERRRGDVRSAPYVVFAVSVSYAFTILCSLAGARVIR